MGRWLLCLLVLLTACGRTGPGGSLGDVRVLVVDSLTGQPVPNAKVMLRQTGGSSAGERMADEAGQAMFLGVRLGDAYQAFASATGYQAGGSSSFKVAGPTQQTVALTSIGGGGGFGGLTGSVKDMATQAPLPGVEIAVDGRSSATSNAMGMFMLEGVTPGPHTIRALSAGYEVLSIQLVVRPGQVAEVETLFMRQERSQGSAGHYLVAMAAAGRVVQFDKAGHEVWSYTGLNTVAGATRLPDGITLMVDTAKRRIQGVDQRGKDRFLFGNGLFRRPLKAPVSVVASRDGQTCLVADRDANKVIELSGKEIVWTYEAGLSAPQYATYTPTGGILIADTGNKRVLEVDRGGMVVWEARAGLYGPAHAQRLPDGRTLVTDPAANRVLEFDGTGRPIWWFDGKSQAPAELPGEAPDYFQTMSWMADEQSVMDQTQTDPVMAQGPNPLLNRPQAAVRYESGHTLIADTGNDRLVMLTPEQQVMWVRERMGGPVSIERL